MVNKRLKFIIRLGISGLFGGFLAFKVDWTLIWRAFRQINLHLFAVSTLLALISSFFIAWKYYLLIRGTALNRSVLSLVKINFISRFYALFLPSAIGPEAVRWYKITSNQTGRIFFLASTVFERVTFLFILHLFGLIPLFFYASDPEITRLREQILPAVIVSISFLCFAMAYFVAPPSRSLFNSIVDRILGYFWKGENIKSFLQSFSLNNPNPSLYLNVIGLSLIWQIFFLCRMFILFKAASIPLSFIDVAWMGSLVLLLQVIPISFAGLGVREGAYAYLFTVFHLAPEKGVLIGILFFVQMLIFAGIGGLLELIKK